MPKRGYRFVASVLEVGDPGTDVFVEEYSRSHLVIEHQDGIALPPRVTANAEQAIQEKALRAGDREKRASWWKWSAVVLAVNIMGIGLAIAITYVWNKGMAATTCVGDEIHPIDTIS